MKLPSGRVLVAGVIVVAGLSIGLPLAFTGGRTAAPAAEQTPTGPRGAGGIARAFERFAKRCLGSDPAPGCSHAAAVLLGRLGEAEDRTSIKSDRVVRICADPSPPVRCSQKQAILSDLRTLQSALRSYVSRVKSAYDVTPIAPAGPGRRAGGSGTTTTGSVELVDETWVCAGPVRLDSVKVTITSEAPRHQGVGIRLDPGCTGTIASIDVRTAIGDGVDVHAAHDLTIAGGSIVCNGHGAAAHQDGIQATAGRRIVFRHVTVDCPTANNSGFYVNAIPGRPDEPQRILFLDGRIGPTMSSTVFIARHQTGSGVRNSVLCPSRYSTFRTAPGSQAVNQGNSYPASC